MSILDTSSIITSLEQNNQSPLFKFGFTPRGANFHHSYWRVGGNPGAGSIPPTVSGEAPTKATTGAIEFNNADTGSKLYLARVEYQTGTFGHYALYDRLVHNSGLVGNTTTEQTVNSAALTRYTTGEGCQLWLEWYTTTGTGTPSCSVSYTNQANIPGRTATSLTWGSNQTVGQLLRVPLQSGDTGIRSVQSVTMNSATGSAGNFGIVIMKPIVDFPVKTSHELIRQDFINLGFPIIENNACLAFMVLCSTSTATTNFYGQLTFVEG